MNPRLTRAIALAVFLTVMVGPAACLLLLAVQP